MIFSQAYQCHCECHGFSSMMAHIAPCCSVCPYCELNVTWLEGHLSDCWGVAQAVREKTGRGMLDCRKAVQEAQGNVEKAIEILEKKDIYNL